jgi:alpha-glucosidase
MNTRMMTLAAAVLATLGGAAHAAPAGQVTVTSPDGRAAIKIARDGGSYTVTRGGETVLAASPLGLEFDGQPDFDRLVLGKVTKSSTDREIPLVATKASSARDHYRAATLHFHDRADRARRLLVDVRAYDDGVAFRYRIDGSAPVRLRGEKTGFVPAGDPDCLVSVFDGAHEVPFARQKISQLDDKRGYDVPVVCTAPSGRTAYAITQANLGGYTGASLWRDGTGLRVHLSGVPGRAAPVYESQGGLQTAWRVVMLGNRAGDLIASNLVGNLNPAPQGDFSWVKPGKAAWDWWSGPLTGMKPDMAAYRRFIDFAAASGFSYYLIDAGWALGTGGCSDAPV